MYRIFKNHDEIKTLDKIAYKLSGSSHIIYEENKYVDYLSTLLISILKCQEQLPNK